jgi:hypothetical protein
MSIESFLAPELAEYYYQVIRIVKILEKVSDAKVVIYGGFIRAIIAGEGRPRDVDLWFTYDWPTASVSTPGIWRRRIQQMIMRLKFEYPDLTVNIVNLSTGAEVGTVSNPVDMRGDDKYEIATININGIDFDFCCNTSDRLSFDELTDFSVNNLYMGADRILKTRVKTDFTVNDIIGHIQNRKLIGSTFKQEKIAKMIGYGYAY